METLTWNLSHIYKSNEEFLADFDTAKKYLKNLEKFNGKLNKKDKKIIKEFFEMDKEFSIIIEKMGVYAHCKNDDNGKDELSIRNYHTLGDFFTEAGKALAFVQSQLSMLDDDFLKSLLNSPEFAEFDVSIKNIIKQKPHTLSEKDEKLLAGISAFQSSDDIYSVLSDIEMDHGSFVDESGKEIKLTTGNYNLLMQNPKQSERKKIQEAYLEKYAALNLTLSNLYLSHIKYESFLAKTYNFKSVIDMSTFGEDVTPQIMQKNIEFVSSKTAILHRFFDIKAKFMKLDKFYTSDISANMASNAKKYTYEEAIREISDCFKVLGKDYVQKFEEAVSTGWIDVFPRENKASGGYTISTFSVHPFILLNFDGTAYWKSAIAHEFGHAMHSYYSAKAQPYDKYDYTIFVAEVASLTNEILLEYYLLEKTFDRNEKIQLIADFLQLFYLNVFNSTMLAEFELFAHTSVENGKTLTGSDLNKKYVELAKKYFGKKVLLSKNFEFDWTRKSHIFSDYYLYKYSTGLISACCVAKKILSDKSGEYVKKYKKFLSLGGSIDPISSLKVAEVDITSNEPYEFAFDMFEEFLDKLESLTKEG